MDMEDSFIELFKKEKTKDIFKFINNFELQLFSFKFSIGIEKTTNTSFQIESRSKNGILEVLVHFFIFLLDVVIEVNCSCINCRRDAWKGKTWMREMLLMLSMKL